MSFVSLTFLIFTLNDPTPQSGLLTDNTQGVFFALSVRDLEKVKDWYVQKLGFELVSQGGNEQRKGAILKGHNVTIELAEFATAMPLNSLKPSVESHEIYGYFKVGFSVKDLDALFKAMESREVTHFFGIVNASDGTRTFAIKDPEGNIIQFFGP